MTNVTCRLTVKELGSAQCPMLIIEYGTTVLLTMAVLMIQ